MGVRACTDGAITGCALPHGELGTERRNVGGVRACPVERQEQLLEDGPCDRFDDVAKDENDARAD
eukprot:4195921-Prymnesium_polylepis.1